MTRFKIASLLGISSLVLAAVASAGTAERSVVSDAFEHDMGAPLTAEEWQAEEDSYVALAEELEQRALRANADGYLELDISAAIGIIGGDGEVLEHFATKVRDLGFLAEPSQLDDIRAMHPLYGKHLNHLAPAESMPGGVMPEEPAILADSFFLPFDYAQTWSTSTYSGHGPCYSNSWDFNRSGDYGLAVLASAPGYLYRRVQTTCSSCSYASTCGSLRANGYGNYDYVSHANGVVTYYAHLSAQYGTDGQYVPRGRLIGAVGTTGCSSGAHLHTDRKQYGTCVKQTFVEGTPCGGCSLTSANWRN